MEPVSFQKAIPILMKSRIEAIYIWSWLTAIMCLLVGKGFPPLIPTTLTLLAMIFIAASVYIYNDINDWEMDLLNPVKKNRPIVTNIVSKEDALKIVYLFGFIGLLFSLSINVYTFIFSFIYYFIFFMYSFPRVRTKKIFFVNDMTIFSGCILCSLIGSYAILGTHSYAALFAGLLVGIFFTFVIKPIFRDMPDENEDVLYGARNLGNVLSWNRKVQILILGMLFMIIATTLFYVQLGFNIILPISVIVLNLILLGLMFPIMSKFDIIKIKKVYRFAHVYFLLLQIIFVIGALDLNLFI